MRRLSMDTRDELVEAIGTRYRVASREEKGRILEEFAAVSGYCRKHASRLLRRQDGPVRSAPRLACRTYDDAVREALIVLWETSDRICGKRLKALIPMLILSMERHGHLALDGEVRARLLKISAATIDRALAPMRASSSGRKRRRAAPSAQRVRRRRYRQTRRRFTAIAIIAAAKAQRETSLAACSRPSRPSPSGGASRAGLDRRRARRPVECASRDEETPAHRTEKQPRQTSRPEPRLC